MRILVLLIPALILSAPSFAQSAFDGPLGLSEIGLRDPNDIVISPNPTSGIFEISSTILKKVDVLLIMDSMGRRVWESDTPNERKQDISTLHPGVYQLFIVSGDRRYTSRIVKR